MILTGIEPAMLRFRDEPTALVVQDQNPVDKPQQEKGNNFSGYQFIVPEHFSVILHSYGC